MTPRGAAAGTRGAGRRPARPAWLPQPPAVAGDEVAAVAEGLGVATAEGDVVERDGLVFGAGLAGVVGTADVGWTSDRDGDGEGADLADADDRAGAGATAACDSGLNSR